MRRCPASAPTSSTTTAQPVANGGGGYLVLTEPWPAMLRGIWGDDERYEDTYWSRFAGQVLLRRRRREARRRRRPLAARPRRRRDERVRATGISTTEVESALVSHPKVAEAAVVGATDATTGQGIVAFVILRAERRATAASDRAPSCAPTSPRRSARSPSPGRSWSSPSCRRPGPARSCAGCCGTSPRTASSATSRRSPTRRS